jgi:hypothetical protein
MSYSEQISEIINKMKISSLSDEEFENLNTELELLKEKDYVEYSLRIIGESRIFNNEQYKWTLEGHFKCLIGYGEKYNVTGFDSVIYFNNEYKKKYR